MDGAKHFVASTINDRTFNNKLLFSIIVEYFANRMVLDQSVAECCTSIEIRPSANVVDDTVEHMCAISLDIHCLTMHVGNVNMEMVERRMVMDVKSQLVVINSPTLAYRFGTLVPDIL